ncbi:MAG: TldD/PmbA family protein [Pseudomonadota bacterium]
MNSDADVEALLRGLLSAAERAGADAADAVLYRGVSHSVTYRLGDLEDVERSEGRDLGLRILVGRRQASVSTTDVSPGALDDLVERCAAMAKAAPEDPYCGLAPKERLAAGPYPDLELGDFAEPTTDVLKDRAAACEAAARAVKGVVNSNGASASYGEGAKWFATSDGFFGTSRGSSHSLSASVLAQDDNGMERDYDYDSKSHLEDMRAADDIGAQAGARTVERLSPQKMKSGAGPVIYDNRLSASLLGHLTGAVGGGAIARGVSFLKDKLGEPVFDASITVTDDPSRKRGAGSRPFDGEGVAGAPIALIDKGVLTSWLLNSAQARQLGLETNGRATRGAGGPPGSGATNLTLQPGDKSLDDLMAEIGEGLLVTDMFGPQVNPNTGDYSVGCAGFRIAGGAKAEPVSEITIAGSLLDMYAGLTPANDLIFRGARNAPSVLIREMTIAGD